ncbi:MAG: class I SAM-dependent rRNA methyltransferase [Candidatus Omnitrophota bacterium]
MLTAKMQKNIILRVQGADKIRPQHPWVYRSQIARCAQEPQPGEVVGVLTHRGQWVGRGYYNALSEITIRLLTRQETEAIDVQFFLKRLRRALEHRRQFVLDTDAYRIVNSEADGLPGLILDRYGPCLVMQILTRGMDLLRPLFLEALRDAVPHEGLYEKSDSSSRSIEGLEPRVEWVKEYGVPQAVVHEKNVQFAVEFGKGHKTALYLDQRENRFLLSELMRGRKVLDAFCHEGAFGLHLAKAGCTVLGIDIQPETIARAEFNRQQNGIAPEQLAFKTANVFNELRAMTSPSRGKLTAQMLYDAVILDPPSFLRKKSSQETAMGAYKEIILRSMKLLRDGGLLAVFSCSYHLDLGLLMHCCLEAAVDSHKNLRVIKFMKQSADHPIDPFIPETYYLKGVLLEICAS